MPWINIYLGMVIDRVLVGSPPVFGRSAQPLGSGYCFGVDVGCAVFVQSSAFGWCCLMVHESSRLL